MKTRRAAFLAALLAILLSANLLLAQKNEDFQDLMQMNLKDLLNVNVVSAARHSQRLIDSPKAVSIVTAREIAERNYRTTPEALNELVGILVQETNYGGGSPIIRGMVGNQILILIDGIRLNNAIFRLGPNQYLNTIDINQIERIEVVRGPGSVLYGSDAIGGLINIITRSRTEFASHFDADTRLSGRYASADNGQTGRIDLSGNVGAVGLTGGFTHKDFGNLRAGTGVGLQAFTGYGEWDVDLKTNLMLSERQHITAGWQKVNQSDLPRTDRLAARSDLKNEWDPEKRDLIYAKYDLGKIGSVVSDFSAGLSYQEQLEDQYIITSSKPAIQQEHRNVARSLGATFQFTSAPGDRQLFTYGAEYYSDRIESRRSDVTIATGARASAKSTFADGSTYSSIAGFAQDEIQLGRRLSLTLGLRHSLFDGEATVTDPLTSTIRINSNPSALTSSARALYRLTADAVITLGIGQGFRAPNIDDLSILGSFGSGFEVPNPNLKPEQSTNYEVGFKVQHRRFAGSLCYFHNDLKDLIDRGSGTFNGLTFLDSNGNGVKDSGEQSVFQRINVGKADIKGIEGDGQMRILNAWSVLGNLAWIQGDNLVDNVPLRRIPPLRGKVGIEWRPESRIWAECYSLFAVKQDRLAPGDVTDPRIPAGGTPGYTTLNLRGGTDLPGIGSVTIGWENMTNKAYRLHSSGLDAPGSNLVVGFRFTFD